MLLSYFISNPRSIFLADAAGALLSTLLLLVLARFEQLFGMPAKALYQLIPATSIFTVYSLCCYLLKPKNWKPYLVVIAIANLVYTGITLALVIHFFETLTWLGLAYFLGEVLVILLLCGLEFRLAAVKLIHIEQK